MCDKSHVHPGGGAGAHAEAKIMNHMSGLPASAMRGGSMLFNIDWRFKSPSGAAKQSGMPCVHCHKMLCKAAGEPPAGCGIQIFLCDKDGKPQQLTKEDCADTPEARRGLSMKIDGHPSPGR
jgi:hypothetical protein